MYTVYLVINGSLGMSPGKIAAQTFQACQRLLDQADDNDHALKHWREQGTKTIVKIAPTQHLFDRCCQEMEGVIMVDEGHNEVEPGSATVFASWPLNRQEQEPRMLRHRRLAML